MPYQPIPLDEDVTGEARAVVRQVIDPYISEFRFLLTVQQPEQGPKGSLQRVLVAPLLAATDGAAQMLHPGSMQIGERFKAFMKANFPWDLDPPDGLSVDEACEFVWHDARCNLLHRFGMPVKATATDEDRPHVHTERGVADTARGRYHSAALHRA
jgi:hypothetical protein